MRAADRRDRVGGSGYLHVRGGLSTEQKEEELSGQSAQLCHRFARPDAYALARPGPVELEPGVAYAATQVATATPDVAPQRGIQVWCEHARLHAVRSAHVFVMNEELVQIRKRPHPPDPEEAWWRARPDPSHQPREVTAFGKPDSPPLGETPERTRECNARSGDQIALSQYEVRSEVVRGPTVEERGRRRPQLVEHVAELPPLVRVESEIIHHDEPRPSTP